MSPRSLWAAEDLACNKQRENESAACLDRIQPSDRPLEVTSRAGSYPPLFYALPGLAARATTTPGRADRAARLVTMAMSAGSSARDDPTALGSADRPALAARARRSGDTDGLVCWLDPEQQCARDGGGSHVRRGALEAGPRRPGRGPWFGSWSRWRARSSRSVGLPARSGSFSTLPWSSSLIGWSEASKIVTRTTSGGMGYGGGPSGSCRSESSMGGDLRLRDHSRRARRDGVDERDRTRCLAVRPSAEGVGRGFGWLDASIPGWAYLAWQGMIAALVVAAVVVRPSSREAHRDSRDGCGRRHCHRPVRNAHGGSSGRRRPGSPSAAVPRRHPSRSRVRSSFATPIASEAGPSGWRCPRSWQWLPSIQIVAWYLNARRHAVGAEGPRFFLTSSEWQPPLGWTPLARGHDRRCLSDRGAPQRHRRSRERRVLRLRPTGLWH